jgi:D-glycero-D-manno-heptose 1,7-bisphosphate phosphatase
VLVARGCDPGPPAPGVPRAVAFFDRDGTLNVDSGYVSTAEAFEWLTGAREALARLASVGFLNVVVTNQSGVGRGLYAEADVAEISHWMAGQAPVHAIFYCPHLPEDECPSRKPAPGLLHAAAAHWPVDRERSFLVGDKERDVQAGEAFGVRSLLFDGGDLDEFLQRSGL